MNFVHFDVSTKSYEIFDQQLGSRRASGVDQLEKKEEEEEENCQKKTLSEHSISCCFFFTPSLFFQQEKRPSSFKYNILLFCRGLFASFFLRKRENNTVSERKKTIREPIHQNAVYSLVVVAYWAPHVFVQWHANVKKMAMKKTTTATTKKKKAMRIIASKMRHRLCLPEKGTRE